MSDYRRAVNLIKKYEGYSERAYPDTVTGSTPYTFGYGTQYYPDGAPVKQGQCCTKDRKSTRLNSSHVSESRMPSSA